MKRPGNENGLLLVPTTNKLDWDENSSAIPPIYFERCWCLGVHQPKHIDIFPEAPKQIGVRAKRPHHFHDHVAPIVAAQCLQPFLVCGV